MRIVLLVALGLIHLSVPAIAKRDTSDPLALAFGTMATFWGASLSPDGSKMVTLQVHPDQSGNEIRIAVILDFASGKQNVVLASEKDRFKIQWCRWANDERLLCGYRAIKTSANSNYPVTRLAAINSDGTDMKVLMQRQLAGTFSQFQDDIVDWLPDDPTHVLIEEPGKGGSGVSRLNIYSGKLRTEIRSRKSVRRWISDGHGQPRLRMSFSERELEWKYRLAGETKWRFPYKEDAGDTEHAYGPVAFGEDPNKLLVFKAHEGRRALWSEDLANDRANVLIYGDRRFIDILVNNA